MINLILASSSPYRHELLQRLEIPFECESPDIDESQIEGETPTQLVLRLAEAKARVIAPAHPKSLIIGSDQVAVANNEILTKPGNHNNARIQLAKISHKSIIFLTGLCVINTTSNKVQKDCVSYTVHFRDLTEDEIERYLLKETPYDCAGSFKSEGTGISLVQRFEGEDPTSLIGLPLIRLSEMLRNEHQEFPLIPD
ncbi:MAG: septum formation inhibitor Maf [Proteobacteria bacterium]|nr:septum formation inhibitor Maf [Pseudomonadota bacterium]